MKIEDAVILVGGKGARLGNITKRVPKPLIKINKKSFLDQLLSRLIKYNFKKIYLLCAYKKIIFFKKYHNKILHNSKIICISEGNQKGTGGALYGLKNKVKKNFLLLNGDTYFDIDIKQLLNKKLGKKLVFMTLSNKKRSVNNYKMTNLKIINGVVKFNSKKTNLINGGIYLVNKNILNNINNNYSSFENDFLYEEIKKNNVIGKYFNNFFIDIGSKEKLNFILKNNSLLQNKCFFLDRDGVINKEIGYLTSYKKLIFFKGFHNAVKFLNNNNYLVILVTNQAAVGKGLISEEELNSIHNYIKKYLLMKNKSIIDDIYYAPYYKNSKFNKFKKNKFDRKPNPGMILKAAQKWNINLSLSYLIGDKNSDKVAAERSNLKFYFKKNISLYKQIKNIIK